METVAPTTSFQRARQPEQVAARRTAILAAARELLATQPVATISLRQLSERVGLAKSNVVRYFDSREAVFLAVLDEEWRAWLADVAASLPAPPIAAGQSGVQTNPSGQTTPGTASAPGAPFAGELAIAAAIAAALLRAPLFCELVSVMAAVLERNVSVTTAMTFKQQFALYTTQLAELVRARLPVLDAAAGEHFAGATLGLLAGIWPLTHPTATVRAAQAALGQPDPAPMVGIYLREGLANQLIGLTARARAGEVSR